LAGSLAKTKVFQYAYRMITEKLVCMLFSDLKGYSKIKNDDLKTNLVKFAENDIIGQLLNPSNHIYVNTWGDAFYICSENPVALAEIALQMRDKIRNKDWVKFGLNEDLEVRIALHTQIARVMSDPDGKISNVVGKAVDTTARIEPVTKPNDVFCSETFHHLLLNENPRNIRSIEVGRMPLAKNFGEMNLFRLVWASEAPLQTVPTTRLTTPMPRINQKPTDRERNNFLYESLSTIRSYLQDALTQLSNANPNVEFSLRDITNTKLICEIYLNGQHKNSCKVWVGGHLLGSNAINYSEGRFDIDNDNSINEILQVEDDGSELYLKSIMGRVYGEVKDKLSPEDAAEHIWKRFTKPLEH
jgi:class 3 adenylate cyclase